jgi:hypothetical protein
MDCIWCWSCSWLVLTQAMHCLTLLKKLVVVQMQLLPSHTHTATSNINRCWSLTYTLTEYNQPGIGNSGGGNGARVSRCSTRSSNNNWNRFCKHHFNNNSCVVLVQVAQMLTTNRTLLCTSGKERHDCRRSYTSH